MIQSKDSEILRLLNQIASDMVKRSDVDEMIAAAVKEAVDKVNEENDRKMKAMAAEYEAVIASLKKKDKGGNKGGKGNAGDRKKPNTETYATKEEAIAALEEAQKKALAMADMAFVGGCEKLTAEIKPAVDPETEDADDDTKVQKPIEQRGNYGQTDYEPIPRAEEYCQYGDIDENDTIHNYFYPEGCDENSTIYGERTHTVWEITKPKLYKIINHMMRCRVGGKKVWGQIPATPLGKSHRGVLYNVNMILRKYRQTDILPILGDIYQKLTLYANNVTGECGTLLMKAIHYAQAEWQGLMRYTTDGRYRPDNNYAEAIMRDLATGRKNFLLSGSDEAANNLAFAYSLTQSCKLCNVNPYDYWEDLLTNAYNPSRTIDSFMPHIWRKQS